MFRKSDLIIYAAILLLAAAAFFIYKGFHSEKGDLVDIRVNGELVMTLPLDEPFEGDIAGYGSSSGFCHLSIHDGYADVTDATCPDLICAAHRPISLQGEAIICLPNRIVIEVVSRDDSDSIDAVSR